MRNYNALTGEYLPLLPEVNVTTTFVYDGLGQTLETVDTFGHRTVQEYDELGNIKDTIANFKGTFSAGSYIPNDSTAVDENIITFANYDALGRVSSITVPVNGITQFDYDGLNRTTQTIRNSVPNAAPSVTTNVTTEYKYGAKVGGKSAVHLAMTGGANPPNRWDWTCYDALDRPSRVIQNVTGQATPTSNVCDDSYFPVLAPASDIRCTRLSRQKNRLFISG